MDPKIIGSILPVLEITLQQEESIISVAGELSWMSSSIEMDTATQHGGGGGMFGAFKRSVSGGSFFMTQYQAKGNPGMVAFAAKLPGSILPIDVSPNKGYLVHRSGFVCGTPDIDLGVGIQRKLGVGLFGGDGFVLQRVSGSGQAWIELGGEIVEYDLKPGETMRVAPGHVGMFEEGVSFDITRIKGIKNMMFGAEGIFLAALTGPGKVWLQSLTISGLAHAIQPFLVTQEASAGVAGGIMGSVLKGMTDK